MSDTTQGQDIGQDAPDDGALFREVLDAPTLDKFENPPDPKVEPRTEPKIEPKAEPKTEGSDGPVPSGRFREESEARRRAEREASDLRAQLAAYQVRTPPQQPQQPKLDVFDDPSRFVKQEVQPILEQFRAELQMTREAMSADNAVRLYGEQQVAAARAELEQGMARQDPNAWATWNRAMSSHDPYGVITRWHSDRETLVQIGGDLNAYKAKILEDAMKNPEFQKQVITAAKGQAQANGSMVNRPAQSKVPTLPSLSDIGASGADEQFSEPSDDALFRAAVSAKRR